MPLEMGGQNATTELVNACVVVKVLEEKHKKHKTGARKEEGNGERKIILVRESGFFR